MENLHAPEMALHAAIQGNISATMALLAQVPDLHHTGASKSAFLKVLELSIAENRPEAKDGLYLMGANRVDWTHDRAIAVKILSNPGFRQSSKQNHFCIKSGRGFNFYFAVQISTKIEQRLMQK